MIREVNYATYSIDELDCMRIIKIDKGFTALTGFEESDIFGKKMTQQDLLPANAWEEYITAVGNSTRPENGDAYLEHPIVCKDGHNIVVLCYGKKRTDNPNIADILITDVTSHIEAQNLVIKQAKENRLLLKKLSFISENEEEFIAEYNCNTDHFTITAIRDGEVKVIASVDHYAKTLPSIATIHPDDLEPYANIFSSAPLLTDRETFEFRSSLLRQGIDSSEPDDYLWYRVTYAPYHDKATNENHIIGRIININQDVMKNQELQRQAQTDSLTSLYNQGTARSKIDEIALQNTEQCINAFIILDLDNFKDINDTYGHATGDEVLRHTGRLLKQFFRFGSDIIGRLGGDEFVIYMRDVPNRDMVQKRCNELCEKIRTPKSYLQQTVKTTASIGVSIQDNGPDSFDHLYKCADLALYEQKNQTKNGVCIYDE